MNTKKICIVGVSVVSILLLITIITSNQKSFLATVNSLGVCNMEVLQPVSGVVDAGALVDVVVKVDHSATSDCVWVVFEGEAGNISADIDGFETVILSNLNSDWLANAINGIPTYWLAQIEIPATTVPGNYSLLLSDNNQADFPEGVTSQFLLPITVQ